MTGSRFSRAWVAVLPFVLATGCGASGTATQRGVEPGAAETTKGEQKQDTEAMFKREAGELASQSISAPDGSWTASVLGQSPPKITIAEGNVAVAEIPIGSSGPVKCHVFDKMVDSAGMITHVLRASAQNVQFQSILPWAITVDNDYPAAWIEAIYLGDQGQDKVVGHLKLAISPRENHSLFCVHDEAGYKESFRRVVQSLLQSFEPSQKPAEPIYMEVNINDIDSVPTGFGRSVLTKEGDGRYRWMTVRLDMHLVGQAELKLGDNYKIEIIDENKELVSGHWVGAEDGELTLNIRLERVQGNLYRYDGQVQGKPIEGNFHTKSHRGLPSSFAVADMLEEQLAKSSSFAISPEQYDPRLDPSAPIEITYRRNAEDPPRVVRMKLGAVEIQAVMDEHGMMSEGHAQIGGHQFNFRRVAHKGKP